MGMSEQYNHALEVCRRRTWLLPAFGVTTSALTAWINTLPKGGPCMNLTLCSYVLRMVYWTTSKMWCLCPQPLQSGPTELLVLTVKSHRVCHVPLSWSRGPTQGFQFPLCCKIHSDSSLTSEIKARSWLQAFELIFWSCYNACLASTSSKRIPATVHLAIWFWDQARLLYIIILVGNQEDTELPRAWSWMCLDLSNGEQLQKNIKAFYFWKQDFILISAGIIDFLNRKKKSTKHAK